MIIHNTKKNFISKDFKHLAIIIGITTKIIPVEVHWSIRKVERYYIVLCCVYQIVSKELPNLNKEIALQMAVKAVNNIVGLNGLVLTLLVFSAFP
jgi:predicted ATP-grasp superfamily ATP-dependent carboligase